MATTHAGCFRWYGKCKHMNRIWVTIERTCKGTAKKKMDIGNKSELSIKTCSEHGSYQGELIGKSETAEGIETIIEKRLMGTEVQKKQTKVKSALWWLYMGTPKGGCDKNMIWSSCKSQQQTNTVCLMPSSHCTIFKLVGSPLFSHCRTIWGRIQSLLFSHCTMDPRQGVSHCTISQ